MEQTDVLRYAIDVLESLRIPYMLVGSFAGGVFGEPRFTQDIDIVIDLTESEIVSFCSAFPSPEFLVSEHAVRDAVRSRFQFNVLHPTSGNKIDFILPRDDEYGREQLERRRRVRVLTDREGYTASAEDVIIGKLWYHAEGGSEKHLRDIACIVRIQRDALDRDYVARWVDRLGFADGWRAIIARLDGEPG